MESSGPYICSEMESHWRILSREMTRFEDILRGSHWLLS